MCVVSAVITAMVILAAVIAELVLYYMKSEWLIIWKVSTANVTNINGSNTFLNQTDPISSTVFNDTFIASINDTTIMADSIVNVTDTIFDEKSTPATGISLHDTIFLAFISALGILAAIVLGLLLHLCFFHVYISFLGLTTYEYIRNQRQSELKKSTIPTATATTTNNKTTLNALKKSSTSTQIYFCSHIDPKNLIENHETKIKHRPKSIYCCDTSMQYENTTHNAFYLCSVLHDRPSPILVPSSMAHELTLNSSRSSRAKTFHCCSEYKQIVKLSDASSQKEYNPTAPNNDGSATDTSSSIDEYVKFFEQCTFCSFKLKTATARHKVSAIEPVITNRQLAETKRSKRTWNCCSNVPESPDTEPTATVQQINTISESVEQKSNHHHHIHHRLRGTYDEHKTNHKNGAKSIPIAANGSTKPTAQQSANRKNRSSLSTNLKGSNRSRVTTQTTWPLRLRHMLRVFGRCQQPHYAQNSTQNHANGMSNEANKHSRNVSPRRNIKQNQIRPMDANEQHDHQHRHRHDNTTNHSSNNDKHKNASTNRRHDTDSIESSDPTNEIVSIKSISMPPPPPVRRKICQTADMQDLAESLSFVQNPSHHHHHYPSRANKQREQQQQQQQQQLQQQHQQQQPKVQPQPAQRSIVNNRRRRKNVFRTRSPNLSPIHESGYSNPTSPQPLRHNSSSQSHGSDTSTSTPKISHQNEKFPSTDRK